MEASNLIAFLTAFFVVLVGTPILIKVAKLKHLVDDPGEERKLHHRSVPTLGGVMIFFAFAFSCLLWYPEADVSTESMRDLKYLLAAVTLLFFLGIKDDIIGMSPTKKLFLHFIVGFILVFMGEFRIHSFHGLFGFDQPLPEWGSVSLSFFVYIVVVNAFNLIDGVDGLASGIGLINAVVFGFWFALSDQMHLAVMAFALAGALLSFLIYNFQPARIFMGDAGSLTIGVIVFAMSIRLIETPEALMPAELSGISTPVLAMAIMVYPLLDTLRVFLVRAVHGKSPFTADRNHLHHRIMEFGLDHRPTVVILYIFNFAIVATALILHFNDPTISFIVSGGTALLSMAVVFILRKSQGEN